jgi:16S rRNA (guanine(966)-N(2))-methyltransferase RsmD
MRIISGKYRGKQIRPPRNIKAKPTTDFAKESLFNILLNYYDPEEVEVLDLFAGTGSITYEFASRDAISVTSVELDPDHCHFIRRTCKELNLDRVHVIRGDVFRYLNKPTQSFDIVFADPPYSHPLLDSLPDMVIGSGILADGGQFILEHPGSISFSAHPRLHRHRKYGGVNFSFFR